MHTILQAHLEDMLIVNTILIIFTALMIWAAISDIRHYILSNKLCLSVALLYPFFIGALFINNALPEIQYIAYSVGISLIIFIILLTLFAYGLIGGGDVKLIPAVTLWAGPALTLKFLLITILCGGIVALLIICFQYIRKYPTKAKSSEKINFSMSKSSESENMKNNIPYGIGISAGGLYVAFELFQALN